MTAESVLRDTRAVLRDEGLRAAVLVRDLDSGAEIGIEPDLVLPVASLVKVPLAVATLDRIDRGELDGTMPLTIEPGRATAPGPVGLSRFRHPATVSVDDLLYLSTALSDNTAADALFSLTGPAEVTSTMARLGLDAVTVRHRMSDLLETPAERLEGPEVHLAHVLAITGGTAGRGHRVPQLDVTRASSGSARAYTDLLHALWRPSGIPPAVASRVRDLMGHNVLRHRLAPDLTTDASRWSSRTGTLLNLRHECGVVEHDDGSAFAITVLTESRVAAVHQPGAEAVMAAAARALRDVLRAHVAPRR